MRSATSTSSATLAARTGCSLAGTMKRAMDSIQAASRSAGLAKRAAAGLRAERTMITRSKPSATTASSSRLASPRFSASGSRPWSCGCTTASVRTPQARSQARERGQLRRLGRPQRALAVVVEARRLEQDQRGVGRRAAAIARSSGPAASTVSTPRSPSRMGSRASTRVWSKRCRPASRRTSSWPKRAGGAGDQQRAFVAGARGGAARFAACKA